MNNEIKQQEIEKMVNCIPTTFTKTQRQLIAEKLVDENYCQLPKGALFLTEEYEKAKKVVAKEVLQDVYDKCFELVDPYDDDCEESKGSIDPDDILSLAEYYGVEIEK